MCSLGRSTPTSRATAQQILKHFWKRFFLLGEPPLSSIATREPTLQDEFHNRYVKSGQYYNMFIVLIILVLWLCRSEVIQTHLATQIKPFNLPEVEALLLVLLHLRFSTFGKHPWSPCQMVTGRPQRLMQGVCETGRLAARGHSDLLRRTYKSF